MPEPLTITLKTLTPLWTGGADGTSDRLHETGLIGSLRWWYEALVRGLGGYACDPTEHACLYDPDKPNKGLCVACQTFGATGWARRFRLAINDTTQPEGPTGSRQATGERLNRDGKSPIWYFQKGKGWGGSFDLSAIPLAAEFNPHLLLGLLKLIERQAGLAAKTQLGYGWIHVTEPKTFDIAAFVRAIVDDAKTQPTKSKELPTLNEMFFAQLTTRDTGLNATLNLRYDVRAAFRKAFNGDQALRHFICGTVKGNNRQASKIHFSQAVNDTMRVWGWIPTNQIPVRGVTRDQVVAQINNTIHTFGTIMYWREFDSPRDTVKRISNTEIFLTSLLEVK